MQGPEIYLSDLSVALPCAVNPTDTARIDAAHRVLVNHEAYFVASSGALETFLGAPHQFTGAVTDPISLARFAPTEASPVRDADGRLFIFESDETAGRYDADPAAYREVKPMMRPVPAAPR